jgi:DNA-binding LytR/AlgR family response regulator
MSKEKILVVEDENLIALEIKKRLEKNKFQVVDILSSGKDAVKYVSKNNVDLILMDIMLDNDMDGIDTAEIINKDNDIPIVYLTAYSDDKTLEKAKKTMSYGYIVKPIEEEKLKINIEMALNKHQLEKSSKLESALKSRDFLKSKKISIKKGEEILLISLDKLVYIEVEEGVVYFYTEEEKFSEKGTLKSWEEKLENFGFYRCHKNFMINLNKIEKLIPGKNNSYLLKMNFYKREIPIARDKIKEIKEIMTI